ncbi:MAG: tRNA (N6-isopentenyl adenosine(37)-C2)-methylthiotransferase MiaB [Deltaproteobacteria bacterium]|nr:tRNA (N6-isopentenyl adenosine(37)-C2)-methylthiotransferase MiaB [Deltaproteobacteria bacterium]
MEKKYYIQTFGCQMNVNDSEQIAALLASAGYEATGQAQKADVIILNTCSIREKAAQKVYSRLGRFKDYKLSNPDIIIAVGGCLAQQWGEKFFKKAPCLDIVFGTHNIQNVPELIKRVQKYSRHITDTAFGVEGRFGGRLSRTVTGRSSAYVSIMQGCNNFCAYCVVPYLRGPEESREFADIVREVENLAAQGVKEVILLGQNVNSYGQTLRIKADFASLLRTIAAVGGIERIRFTTSHPKDISPELIRCFEEVDILCEHIHLPVQSGSDKVLRDMNRRYTKADYLQKVAALRAACPDISITSDVIVGFPGETDADFAETIDLLDKIRFDNLFSFKYSEREGTAAAKFDNKVSERVKSARLKSLQLLQEQHTLAKNRSMLGKILDVLVEKRSKGSAGEVMGRTRTNKIVNFAGGSELVGKTLPVFITHAYQHSLHGELLQEREIERCS